MTRPLDFCYVESQKRIARMVATERMRLLGDFVYELENLRNDYKDRFCEARDALRRLDEECQSLGEWQRLYGDLV